MHARHTGKAECTHNMVMDIDGCVRTFCIHGLEPASKIILYCTFEPDWNSKFKTLDMDLFSKPGAREQAKQVQV